MCIDWYANDMGFSTCGQDGQVYFYKLYSPESNAPRNDREWEFSKRDCKFSSVVNLNIPGRPNQFLAVGSEKVIFTETEQLKTIPRGSTDTVTSLPELKHHLSQLVMHHSGRIVFAGVGEQGDVPYPGAVQVWKLPFEQAQVIQAHASAVTRLRITHTNTFLFSTGVDGMLSIFEVRDRDPKRDPEGGQGQLKFSQEILSEKTEVEQLNADAEQLKNKKQNQQENPMEVDIQLNVKSQ